MSRITFDRLRLSIPNNYIEIIEDSSFTTTSSEGEVLRIRYDQTSPFFYRIIKETGKSTTTLEFNGKVLMDDYPLLINVENITKCFENINRQGICYVSVQPAIETSIVLQCDVTCDVPSKYTIRELYSKTCLSSSKKWCIRDVTSNRFTIESTNTTKRLKSRLVVYDKEEEMTRKPNKDFLYSVTNPDVQLNYFQEKVRYELNLNSIDRIRHFFGFDKECPTRLTDILSSTSDPIGKFLSESLSNNYSLEKAVEVTGNLRDLEHLLLLAICNFDLGKLELVIRDMYGSSRSIKRAKEPYASLMTKLKERLPSPEAGPVFREIRARLQYMLSTVFANHSQSSPNLINLYHSKTLLITKESKDYSTERTDQLRTSESGLFDIPFIVAPCLPE